jgi:hypothetical protein
MAKSNKCLVGGVGVGHWLLAALVVGCSGAPQDQFEDGASGDKAEEEIGKSTQPLKIAVMSGQTSQWSTAKQRNLVYCIPTTGWPSSAFRTKIVNAYETAAAEWNRTADVKMTHDSSKDSTCTVGASGIDFPVYYHPGTGCAGDTHPGQGQACSFLGPLDSAHEHSIQIGVENTLQCPAPGCADYPRQARHELGHMLGWVHESDPSGPGNLALTAFDNNSIMANGATISPLDRQGSQSIYGIPWENTSGPFTPTFAPGTASWGSGRLDIYSVDSSSNVQHLWYDGGWGTWENLGKPASGATSSPGAVGRGFGRVDAFVRGSDNAMWRRSYDYYAGGWQAWASEGGVINGAPGAASWATTRWDVFAVGGGGNLYHKWNDGSPHAWENWGKPSGVTLTGGAAATSRGVGLLDAYVRGTDQKIYQMYYTSSAGITWVTMGLFPFGTLAGDLAVTTMGTDGHLLLLAKTTDGRLYGNTYTNSTGWQGWKWMSHFVSDVAVISWGADRMDLFARRTPSNPIEHGYYSAGYWY